VRNVFKGPTPMPDVITLKQRGSEHWADKRGIENLTSPLALRGFVHVGYYGIAEVLDVGLMFWIKEDEKILAVIAEDIRRGQWVEMISFYEDGSDWWYSTSESATSNLSRKGSKREYPGKVVPHQLYARLRQERPPVGLLPVTAENAQGLYEQAYSAHRAFLRHKKDLADAKAAQAKKGKVARK
jgi:hypothetical protein